MRTWQTIRISTLPHHSHQKSYAALVLSGAYEEAGDQGRFYVEAGDVILHDCFEAHLNRFSPSGARVLNLPLPPAYTFKPSVGRVEDMDLLVRTDPAPFPVSGERREQPRMSRAGYGASRGEEGDALYAVKIRYVADPRASNPLKWRSAATFDLNRCESPAGDRCSPRARRGWRRPKRR
jgi:hypothetical protein